MSLGFTRNDADLLPEGQTSDADQEQIGGTGGMANAALIGEGLISLLMARMFQARVDHVKN